MTEFIDALAVGTKIQSYEIRKVLGRGGFGITYLAQDEHLDMSVAIKEFFPVDLAFRDERGEVQAKSSLHENQFNWGRDRFLQEARTLARFKHKNIVRVLTFFEMNRTAYMVMEYEQGKSLNVVLAVRKSLSEKELLAMLMPLLDGLDALHGAGFIHRDIKPDNIYLREDNSPVLLDFGSARVDSAEDSRTMTALISPGYAPFEQYYKKSRQGAWTDIYAVGAVLYRVITGEKPIESTERSDARLRGEEDPMKSTLEAGAGRYSENTLRAVDHALMVLEKDRPQSIAEWKKEFGEALTPESAATKVLAAPPPAREREVKGGGEERKKFEFQKPKPQPRPFWSWLWVAECAAAVGAVYYGLFPSVTEAFKSESPAPPLTFFEGIFASLPARFLWLGGVSLLSVVVAWLVMRPISARLRVGVVRVVIGLILFNALWAGTLWGMVGLFQELHERLPWF